MLSPMTLGFAATSVRHRYWLLLPIGCKKILNIGIEIEHIIINTLIHRFKHTNNANKYISVLDVFFSSTNKQTPK